MGFQDDIETGPQRDRWGRPLLIPASGGERQIYRSSTHEATSPLSVDLKLNRFAGEIAALLSSAWRYLSKVKTQV